MNHTAPRVSQTSLPAFIERIAFELGAMYRPNPVTARNNLQADEQRVKAYLGTYMPRYLFRYPLLFRSDL